MSSDPIARKPGQFASERFRSRHRTWLRRWGWLLCGVAVAELALVVAFGAVFQPNHMGFYWGLGCGIAVTMVIALADSPPEHIDRWRRGAYGEKATARKLRRLTRNGWILLNDIDVGRGNLDHVLVGPAGVYLLESKWLAGAVSVSRGVLTVTWREDPDDGYENRSFAPRARTHAALVSCHLRDAGIRGLWVQPVIVLWATFEQDPVVSDGVAWVSGKQLVDALLRKPIRLSHDDVKRVATVLRSLGTEASAPGTRNVPPPRRASSSL